MHRAPRPSKRRRLETGAGLVAGTRTRRLIVLALLVAFFLPVACLATAKEPLEPTGERRIVAISDIHGALGNLRKILQATHLMDDDDKWIGGNTIFVQTGDFLDRGPETRKVGELLMDLQRQAPLHGGKVIVLLGNHEVLNMVGDMRYVADLDKSIDDESPARQEAHCEEWIETALLGVSRRRAPKERRLKERCLEETPLGMVEYQTEMSPQGTLGAWLRTLPAVVEVNDVLFLHAGISPSTARLSVADINRTVKEEIAAFDRVRQSLVDRGAISSTTPLPRILAAAEALRGNLSRREQIDLHRMQSFEKWFLIHPEGPLWFRGYARWSEAEGHKEMNEILSKLGVEHVVVGHTPQKKFSILGRFDNRVFLIDTGMLSTHYKGRASALEIQDGIFNALYLDSTEMLVDTRHSN